MHSLFGFIVTLGCLLVGLGVQFQNGFVAGLGTYVVACTLAATKANRNDHGR